MAGNAGSWTRRAVLPAASLLLPQAARATERLRFEELYAGWSVTGLSFSDRVRELTGQPVTMRGFMAPPLKAEASFFVLTREPMAMCPFCSTDADWPADIVVAYMRRSLEAVDFTRRIETTGRLERGSWTDPDSGFLSQIRLRDASFREL